MRQKWHDRAAVLTRQDYAHNGYEESCWSYERHGVCFVLYSLVQHKAEIVAEPGPRLNFTVVKVFTTNWFRCRSLVGWQSIAKVRVKHVSVVGDSGPSCG
jgi:hypothetical protein